MTEEKTNRTELDGYTTTDIFNESELQYKVESDEQTEGLNSCGKWYLYTQHPC